MKTYNKPSASKLVVQFDKQLKNIIMNDLKALRSAKTQFVNNGQLSAA